MILHSVQCPYCWQDLELVIDPSVEDQVYIEDCAVCCNPIEIKVHVREGVLQDLSVRNLDQ